MASIKVAAVGKLNFYWVLGDKDRNLEVVISVRVLGDQSRNRASCHFRLGSGGSE